MVIRPSGPCNLVEGDYYGTSKFAPNCAGAEATRECRPYNTMLDQGVVSKLCSRTEKRRDERQVRSFFRQCTTRAFLFYVALHTVVYLWAVAGGR